MNWLKVIHCHRQSSAKSRNHRKKTLILKDSRHRDFSAVFTKFGLL